MKKQFYFVSCIKVHFFFSNRYTHSFLLDGKWHWRMSYDSYLKWVHLYTFSSYCNYRLIQNRRNHFTGNWGQSGSPGGWRSSPKYRYLGVKVAVLRFCRRILILSRMNLSVNEKVCYVSIMMQYDIRRQTLDSLKLILCKGTSEAPHPTGRRTAFSPGVGDPEVSDETFNSRGSWFPKLDF